MNSSHPQSASREAASSLPLFDEKQASMGSFNDDLQVREIVTSSIKSSGKSRQQIADEMSLLLGLRITERMITSFTAESKEMHRWPGAWDRAFCQAAHDDRLLRFRAELSGLQVIGSEGAALLELGRQHLIQKRAAALIEQLERQLQGVSL
jgi:hypothetical protein